MSEAGIQSVLDGRINYAQCWEDFNVLRTALRVKKGDRVLSICSAGDNSLALAIDGASEVICIDVSAPQLALAELKWVASQELKQSGIMTLLGLNDAGRRVFLYHQIRDKLSSPSQLWWDHNEKIIRTGVLESGRFERYLELFRTRILPLIHRRKKVLTLANLRDLEEQQDFYSQQWNNVRWKLLFRLFFSRRAMASMGRSKEQFNYVEGPVSEAFLQRTKHALTQIPIRSNPYLQWILRGEYPNIEETHPYLSSEGLKRLKSRSSTMTFVHSGVVEYLQKCEPNSIDAFNFSNIFEYLSPAEYEEILRLSIRAATDGARVAYWNLLAPRSCPESLRSDLISLHDRANALHHQDRAFFYSRFHLEVVDKSGTRHG
jgi:S-adenosylmethionine-diacylglycerol 3-amino-3-carboxypropyl transferase